MKFSIKVSADGAEVSVGGKRIEDRVIGVEVRVVPSQLPQVVLTLVPSEVDVELVRAAVTQVEAVAPQPPAPPANRAERRAGKKK